MRKNLLIISALALFQINLNAQDIQNTENKSFWQSLWGSVEVGYGRSFENGYSGYNMYLASLRAKIGYYLSPRFSLGVGLNGYHNYPINTLPVVLDIRYHPVKTLSNLYVYADIGVIITSKEKRIFHAFVAISKKALSLQHLIIHAKMMETKTNSGQTATSAPKNKVAGKASMLDGSAHSVNRV